MLAWIGYNAVVGMIAYLFGSIPTGYWLGKLLKGIDIREHGSESTGATNVLRTLGKVPALAALLIDLLKGVAAVAFARWLYSLPAVWLPPNQLLSTWELGYRGQSWWRRCSQSWDIADRSGSGSRVGNRQQRVWAYCWQHLGK
jgi:Glycerol-3-phosphate acyltransferase